MTSSEHDRQRIAEKEYDPKLVEGRPVVIIGDDNEKKTIGTVSKIIDDEVTGVQAMVIEEPNGNVSVLFQGSKAPGEEGWVEDWLETDIPMATQILYNNSNNNPSDDLTFTPRQLEVSALILRSTMLQYPDAKFSVYGHSLGSMNVQFALANLEDSQLMRIDGAWIYNGPNIYSTLTEREKEKIDSIKTRITNYIDTKDIIGLGYPESGSKNASGMEKRIDSKVATTKMQENLFKQTFSLNSMQNMKMVGGMLLAWFEDQHVWGGYVWDSNGNVKLSKKDQQIYDSEMKYYSITVESGLKLKSIEPLKTKWSNGGISSSEELFLDVAQSYVIGKSMAGTAKAGLDEMTALKTKADAEVASIWSKVDFSIYSELSAWEVRDIFASHGVTHQEIVSDFHDYTQKKVKKMEKLSTAFDTLKTKLDEAVESKKALDGKLAGEFSAWHESL